LLYEKIILPFHAFTEARSAHEEGVGVGVNVGVGCKSISPIDACFIRTKSLASPDTLESRLRKCGYSIGLRTYTTRQQ
jgi:hypothetical protein